jgi:glycosyltransferase involved in cell wall biosynthesis
MNLKNIHTPSLRAAFLTVMPTPYSQDLFRAMQGDGRISPQVFYLEMAAPDTYWGETRLPDYATILPGFWVPFLGGRLHINCGVIRAIAEAHPDVVVVAGYAGVTNQWVMWWLRRQRIPWVFWGELPGMRRRRTIGAALRRVAQFPAVRWADGIAAVGSRAVEAYAQMSGTRCPIENIPYCCDMTPFFTISRTEKRSGDRLRFLYCGQLIHRKGVDLLLDAFCQIADASPNIELALIGEGPLRAELQEKVPTSIGRRVHVAGFQPVAHLPESFAAADVFVLPSRHDGWGVVVNQAVAAGMPIICSDAVGAAADLVVENENGNLFPTGNAQRLGEIIASFAHNPEKIQVLGKRSRDLAIQWTPERAVDRWHDLLSTIARVNMKVDSSESGLEFQTGYASRKGAYS